MARIDGFKRVKIHYMRSSATPTVQARMAERRERILEAARDLIADEGFEGLTMRALAKASRVTVPTLYNLVGSRNRVLREAVREQTARFAAGIQTSPGAPPGEEVLSVADSCCNELLGRPAYYRPLLAWIFGSEGANEVRQEVGEALSRELRIAIEALAAQGGMVAWIDRDALALGLAGHLGAASLRWSSGEIDDRSFSASARFDIALALLGLTSGEARAHLEQAALEAQAEIAARPPQAVPAAWQKA